MTRFLHFADCHLGYKQYNHKERFNDFARAFLDVIDRAIDAQVDFVILAGDLFQKRAIDALTLNQAMVGLERLERAAIPCIAVEGNHEHAYYQDAVGWMEFLAQRRLLILLDAEFADGAPLLTPYSATRRRGAYIDPVPGVRVYGMRYYGAGTPAAVEAYAAALGEQPPVQENGDPVDYTIFIAHGGVEGVLADEAGGLSVRQWSALKPYVDYLALGHIHKPYQFDDWIFNPGSTETCSISEAEWRERGYYLVDIHPADEDERKHAVTLHANRRRPFFRFSYKVDHDQSPMELESKAGEFLLRKARDLRVDRLGDDARPVVDLQLTGVLPFDRGALRLDLLETMARDAFDPLHVLIKNHTRSAEFAIDADENLSRTQLERRVLADLLARDQRFAHKSDDWARLAVTLKQMALTGAGADAVLEEISAVINR